MKQLVLTIVGKDQSGLVESVSNIVMSHNGSWLSSNLSHLAGYFAGIVQVKIPDEKVDDLKQQLANLEHVTVQDEIQAPEVQGEKLNFVITGNDRPGIVHELSAIIKHKGANIVQFTSNQQSAPNWGVPLFNAVATVQLPVGLCREVVIEALESLTSDLIVDIEVV
jgi:glycine cleavage system regulatory protein